MRVMAYVVCVSCCLGLAGCKAFGKKSSTASNPAAGGAAGSGPYVAPERAGLGTASARPAPPGTNGMLAGQVVDSYNRRPPAATSIRVVPANQAASAPAAPMEVTVDTLGYFTIQGLQAGQHYQLIARGRDGERMLAGTTWVTPPDPKVLIRISEDFATENTPPLPAAPSLPNTKNPSPTNVLPPPSWPDRTGNDGSIKPSDVSPRRAAEIAPPVPAKADVRPELIADDSRQLARAAPLTIVPSPTGPKDGPTTPSPGPAGPARVPSCVLTGKQLVNFALHDLNGQPWEFRNRQGRLVLLDFWGTWCTNCLQGIPNLNVLQQRYGRHGLEVIGIAYEYGTPPQQAEKVIRLHSWKRIDYRVLMGSGLEAECPVLSQFRVSQFPTLVLLDESGRIIWRTDQGLTAERLQELEARIRQQLNVN